MCGSACGSPHTPMPKSPAHEMAEMRSAWWAPGSDDENRCCTRRPATPTGERGPGTFEIDRLNSRALPASLRATFSTRLTLPSAWKNSCSSSASSRVQLRLAFPKA